MSRKHLRIPYCPRLLLRLDGVDPRIDALLIAPGDTEAHTDVFEMPLRKDEFLSNWGFRARNMLSQAAQQNRDIASQYVDRQWFAFHYSGLLY